MIFDGEGLGTLIDRYVNGPKCERNRKILRAYYLDGFTYEQTAALCEVAPTTVSRVIHKHGDPLLLMLADGIK